MTEERTYRFEDMVEFNVNTETQKEGNIIVPSPYVTVTIRCRSFEELHRYVDMKGQ